MSLQYSPKNNPRVIIIQKLYAKFFNDEEKLDFPKHRFKKFIKDVVQGTLERDELIKETVKKHLGEDLNLPRTDKLLKLIIFAAVYELMFKHNNPTKVIISEYLKTSEHFLEQAQIKYLNAILDKISKKIRAK